MICSYSKAPYRPKGRIDWRTALHFPGVYETKDSSPTNWERVISYKGALFFWYEDEEDNRFMEVCNEWVCDDPEELVLVQERIPRIRKRLLLSALHEQKNWD
jgi:hypothetical protein